MRQVPDILKELPDAFLPELLKGQLAEAESFARYWWLAQAVEGRRVLDAGCGVAHGTHLLAEANAKEVVGIDIAAALLEAAPTGNSTVRLELADVCELPHPDESFEVVAAFGLLDQVSDPKRALAELLRVLAPDGLIVVSLPPSAREEFSPPEDPEAERPELGFLWKATPLLKAVEKTIAHGCRHQTVLNQRNWTTSAILSDADAEASGGASLEEIDVRKVAAAASNSEVMTLIVGSREGEPKLNGTAVITHEFAQRRWLERSLALERRLAELTHLEQDLEDLRHERKLLAERLHALEQPSP